MVRDRRHRRPKRPSGAILVRLKALPHILPEWPGETEATLMSARLGRARILPWSRARIAGCALSRHRWRRAPATAKV
jgi:hypothetical protein